MTMAVKKTVAVLGASTNPERYSNKVVVSLLEHGYEVIPVNPAGPVICGLQAVKDLAAVKQPVHTLTMYINPERSSALHDEIIALNPERVIFNPGTENPALTALCREHGIKTLEACTLVLLETGQF